MQRRQLPRPLTLNPALGFKTPRRRGAEIAEEGNKRTSQYAHPSGEPIRHLDSALTLRPLRPLRLCVKNPNSGFRISLFQEGVCEDDELSHEDGEREFFGVTGGDQAAVERFEGGVREPRRSVS